MIIIFKTKIFILIFIIALISGCSKEQLLSIHIIDVSQGDSILIQTPNNKNILIDGGNENCEKIIKSYLKKENVQTIDMIFATHPDSDHIGSLDYVIENFDVKKIYMPNVTYESSSFVNLINACKNNNLEINYLYKDDLIKIDNITIKILNPSYIQDDNNLNSLAFRLDYNNKSFLFTGDIEISNELDIINSYNLNDIDFLKVSHHGSNTSTSKEFLSNTTPDVAVISCGYKNNYGHPHQSTLDNLEKFNVEVYRTDLLGDIVFFCDGEIIFTKKNYNK